MGAISRTDTSAVITGLFVPVCSTVGTIPITTIPYPDLLALWRQAHRGQPLAAEPPLETEVHAWAERVRVGWGGLERWPGLLGGGAGSLGPPNPPGLADIPDLTALAPEEREHWIEIRIVDADDQPIGGVGLTLVRPDGAREPARTDDDGLARWLRLPDGRARVIFDDDAQASYAEVG
jgi:hypothetical protein